MAKDSPTFTATTIAKLLDVSLARVGQLAKEGVITKLQNKRYPADAIPQYIRWLREQNKRKSGFGSLLEEQKYLAAKRENDLANGRVFPVEVLESALSRVVSAWLPILEAVPVEWKRDFPETTGDELEQVKRFVAKLRNALAQAAIDAED